MSRKFLLPSTGVLALCLNGTIAGAQDVTLTGYADLLDRAAVEYSTDGGATFSVEPPVVAPRSTSLVTIRLAFRFPPVTDSAARDYASLTLSHDVSSPLRAMRVVLNNRQIAPPLEGMLYRTLAGIDPERLKPGPNTLVVEMEVRNRSWESDMVFAPTISLTALSDSDVDFRTGPLLGAFGPGFFSLTCRTNMPAAVSVYRLEAGQPLQDRDRLDRVAGSGFGLLHRLRVPRPGSAEATAYAVVAERDGFAVSKTIEPPGPLEHTFKFVVVGDTRTNIEDWHRVAGAVAASRPDLVVHVGDMVSNGRRDWEWDSEFWLPGRVLFESVPIYPVIGNHEANAPLYDEIAFTPSEDGRARNWAQEVSGVLLIGIDGAQDWSAEGANAAWLEETLSRSTARFTFLFTHYPGWSSANHGRVDEAGQPVERPVREARETIMPILSEYGATAFVAGHDHAYERSELPGGLTAITCGGGGAGLYSKSEGAEIQNPYSQTFFDRHHFCVFDVEHDRITLRAVTPDGELLDSREWLAAGDPD